MMLGCSSRSCRSSQPKQASCSCGCGSRFADIAVVPPEVDDGQHVVEQLPGRADEWLAAQVLLLAGAFPDEDDGRGAWSDAEHDTVARGG